MRYQDERFKLDSQFQSDDDEEEDAENEKNHGWLYDLLFV